MTRHATLLLLLLTGGCTLGPNYQAPTSPGAVAPRYARASDAEDAAPGVARWWTQLNDPLLDRLEERGLAESPDVAAAQARLRQARAGYRLERANAKPTAGASALYLHGELPPTNLGAIGSDQAEDGEEASRTSLDFYNVGFDASWEIDLFGGRRRAAEAAGAAAEAAAARVGDAQVSLTAEIAQAYVDLRDRQARLTLARDDLALAIRQIGYGELRVRGGTATADQLLPLRREVENATAAVTRLTAERDVFLNALAILTGALPGTLDAELAAPAPVPRPPAAVQVGDPASLLLRRPDIRAAERTLAGQSARIGVAEASRLPRISFMGLVGIGGSSPGDVLDPGNLSALALPRLSWGFLDFGRGAAQVEQARGVRDEALAQYNGTVLLAMRDVEDALTRFGAQRQALATALRQQAIASDARAAAQRRFAGGTARVGDVVDADRQSIRSRSDVSMATAAVTKDFIALQKSLGLGWTPAS